MDSLRYSIRMSLKFNYFNNWGLRPVDAGVLISCSLTSVISLFSYHFLPSITFFKDLRIPIAHSQHRFLFRRNLRGKFTWSSVILKCFYPKLRVNFTSSIIGTQEEIGAKEVGTGRLAQRGDSLRRNVDDSQVEHFKKRLSIDPIQQQHSDLLSMKVFKKREFAASHRQIWKRRVWWNSPGKGWHLTKIPEPWFKKHGRFFRPLRILPIPHHMCIRRVPRKK